MRHSQKVLNLTKRTFLAAASGLCMVGLVGGVTTQALITGVSRDDAGLVMTFTELPRGVRVRLDFRMAFGQAASDSDMERNLCGVVTAILGGAS